MQGLPISLMRNDSTHDNETNALAGSYTGDAVGVPASWYVAIVSYNTEKRVAEQLEKSGYDSFVATQEEYRQWSNGRKARVKRVVIPCMVFVRCTERERLQIVNLPYINRFLTDKAATPTAYGRKVARIPDIQMAKLRFMLGQSDMPVGFVQGPLKKGDEVRVVRGSLRGLEGIMHTDSEGKSALVVRLDVLGGALVQIHPSDLERISL